MTAMARTGTQMLVRTGPSSAAAMHQAASSAGWRLCRQKSGASSTHEALALVKVRLGERSRTPSATQAAAAPAPRAATCATKPTIRVRDNESMMINVSNFLSVPGARTDGHSPLTWQVAASRSSRPSASRGGLGRVLLQPANRGGPAAAGLGADLSRRVDPSKPHASEDRRLCCSSNSSLNEWLIDRIACVSQNRRRVEAVQFLIRDCPASVQRRRIPRPLPRKLRRPPARRPPAQRLPARRLPAQRPRALCAPRP